MIGDHHSVKWFNAIYRQNGMVYALCASVATFYAHENHCMQVKRNEDHSTTTTKTTSVCYFYCFKHGFHIWLAPLFFLSTTWHWYFHQFQHIFTWSHIYLFICCFFFSSQNYFTHWLINQTINNINIKLRNSIDLYLNSKFMALSLPSRQCQEKRIQRC